MMKERTLRAVAGAVLALGLAATGRAQSSSANFNNLVVIGDSLAAGYSSNSLVFTHQANSVPALIAKQANVADFEQPLISQPGIPPELTLVSLGGGAGPLIVPKATTPGGPTNLGLARPYNNLAVPGATSIDALNTVADSNPFTGIILRGFGTQVAQAVSSRPTFALVWIGNNDVLGAAIRGEAIDGVTLTPPELFAKVYGGIISAVKSSGATVVAANLPDVTTIPFVRTIKPYVVNPATGEPVLVNGSPLPLIGPTGPLPSNAFVTLAAAPYLAQGVGIPTPLGGTGLPLPDQVILDANKVAIIQAHVDADNQAIQQICSAANVPVVDLHGTLNQISASGLDIGGIHLSADFLTGGLFSYDGVHLTDLGYAIVANEWIAVINAQGGSLGPVDLGPFLGVGVQSLKARPAGVPEFSREAYEELLRVFPEVGRR